MITSRRRAADRRVVLLGPQHTSQTVARAVEDLGVTGPVATITAGWEEREGEDAELSQHLGGRTRSLSLYPRAEAVFTEDESVRGLFYERIRRMRDLRSLYQLRLAPQLQTCRTLLERTDPAAPDALHGPEIEGAIAGIRSLDAEHLTRTAGLEAEISERMTSPSRPAIERHRAELADILDDVDAVLIAGGHVGVLMDRLRLFDVFSAIPTTPVVAWSGGAIVVAERIVLFHDSPPQGRGDPEVHAPGLGLVSGLVALPHAADRLRLEDPARVSLFARRFAPDLCVALDSDARIDVDGPHATWRATEATRILGTDGRVLEMQPA